MVDLLVGLDACVAMLNVSKVDEAFSLEIQSYPEDEAASLDALRYRQSEAPQYFLGGFSTKRDFSGELIGFVCGTKTVSTILDHHSMSHHESSGSTLCIHSVVTHPKVRRQGYATALLTRYIDIVFGNDSDLQVILLVAKAHLVRFYALCGFSLVGVSSLEHGQDTWYEMRMTRGDWDRAAAKNGTGAREGRQRVTVVDAFCSAPFEGNPAGVVLLPGSGPWSRDEKEETWMKAVAREMNLSETAFLRTTAGDGSSTATSGGEQERSFHLRWLTPKTEVDLCGHATLASAHKLWAGGHVPETCALRFHTLSGELLVKRLVADDDEVWIEMDFPAELFVEVIVQRSSPPQLLSHLGLSSEHVLFVGRNRMHFMVEVCSVEVLAQLVPNLMGLVDTVEDCRGVIVTAAGAPPAVPTATTAGGGGGVIGASSSSSKVSPPTTTTTVSSSGDSMADVACSSTGDAPIDFCSRYFAPRMGINEDPVTGSAHCGLGPYWSDKLGKSEVVGRQISTRGGNVKVRVVDDADNSGSARVKLLGRAVTCIEGEILPLLF